MNETKPCPPDWLINDIAEASTDASRAFLFYIGYISYCLLTEVSTTDRQLILTKPMVILPIINISVSLDVFLILAPLIAILVFVYFQVYLSRLNSLITVLRENYTQTVRGRLSQWMINIAEGSETSIRGKIETIVVNFAFWWTLPLMLIFFGLFILKRHSVGLSFILGVLFPLIGTYIALSWWCVHDKVDFDFKHLIRNPGKRALACCLFIILIFLVLTFFLIFHNAKSGRMWYTPARYFHYWISVNLSYQKLITEQEQDYDGIYWADLKDAHLEIANLTSSVLKRANLEKAHLQGAALYRSLLEEAGLRGAHLGGAILKGADLSGAQLQGANLRYANLQGAKNLTIEQLSKVKTLYEATLDSSVMEQIQKRYPHLLEKPKYGN